MLFHTLDSDLPALLHSSWSCNQNSRCLALPQINWDHEKSCFDGFAREYSRFCGLRHDPFLVDSEKTEKASSSNSTTACLTDQVRWARGVVLYRKGVIQHKVELLAGLG